MRFISILLTNVCLFFLLLCLSPSDAMAVEVNFNPNPVDENAPTAIIEFTGLVPGKTYYIGNYPGTGNNTRTVLISGPAVDGKMSITVCAGGQNSLKKDCDNNDYFHGGKTYKAWIGTRGGGDSVIEQGIVKEAQFVVAKFFPQITLGPTPIVKTNPIVITITGSRWPPQNTDRNKYSFDLSGKAVDGTNVNTSDPSDIIVPPSGTETTQFGPLSQNGDYTLKVKYSGDVIKTFTFKITDTGVSVGSSGGGGGGPHGQNPCAAGRADPASCPTALGDIPTDPTIFVGKILSIALGLAGGIALIFMVVGSIKILVSSGDPKKIGDGRDIIVAAISGLLFLILSVLILKFIGIAVLPTNPFG